jgi:hypothetical protein
MKVESLPLEVLEILNANNVYDKVCKTNKVLDILSEMGALHGSEHFSIIKDWKNVRLEEFPEGGRVVKINDTYYLGVRGLGHGKDSLDGTYNRGGTGYSKWVEIPERFYKYF